MDQSEPGLKKFIFWLLAAVLLTPLWVNSRFFFPFITTKTLYVRLVIEVALFCYLILIASHPQYRPRRSLIWWAGGAYLGVVVLASIFGVNFSRSFWGNVERGEGIIMLLHLAAYAVIVASVVASEREWFRFMEVSIVVSLLASFLAFAQAAGVPFISTSTTGARFSSTVGNPSFFAAYLLFNLFFLMYLFWRRTEVGRRIAYAVAWLVFLGTLFGTATRGALLAFGLTLFGLFGVGVWRSRERWARWGAGVGVILIVSTAGVVWLSREARWVKENPVLERLSSISRTDITTQSRLAVWKSSFGAWREHFLLGVGYENYNVPFSKHFPPAIYRDEGSQIWFDRAHSIFFDIAVTSGLAGLLSYGALFAAAGIVLWRRARTAGWDFWSVAIMAALLTAYFLQNLFVFDTLASYLPFMLVLAWLASSDAGIDSSSRATPQWLSLGAVKGAFGVSLAVGLIVFVFRPALANRTLATAVKTGQAGEVGAATALFEEVLQYGDYQRFEARQQFAQFAGTVGADTRFDASERREALAAAIRAMEQSLREAPRDVQNYLQLMELLNTAAAFEPSNYERVIELGAQAMRLSSSRPQLYYSLAQARIGQGRPAEGAELLEKAVALAPQVGEARWNLGAAYAFAGDREGMAREFALAEQFGFTLDNPQRLNRYLIVYSKLRDYQSMAAVLERYVRLNSVTAADTTAWARLAALYKELGEFGKSEQALRKAVELDSRLRPEAEQFLQLLRASSSAAGH
ncbi:O-antigen ligase family protein [Candidatus Parcubacteria bacterium]|nr:O-antigen ligase family protein [Candidatus Parcubacteria bacterium]